MTTVLYVAGFALIAFAFIRHERRVASINRNSSRSLSEAQKKAPSRASTKGQEFGGTKLP